MRTSDKSVSINQPVAFSLPVDGGSRSSLKVGTPRAVMSLMHAYSRYNPLHALRDVSNDQLSPRTPAEALTTATRVLVLEERREQV